MAPTAFWPTRSSAETGRNARLNVIRHLLSKVRYEDLTPEPIQLPPRPPMGDYRVPDDLRLEFIPEHYG